LGSEKAHFNSLLISGLAKKGWYCPLWLEAETDLGPFWSRSGSVLVKFRNRWENAGVSDGSGTVPERSQNGVGPKPEGKGPTHFVSHDSLTTISKFAVSSCQIMLKGARGVVER